MRLDDEHRLIARYAARLAADSSNAVSTSDLFVIVIKFKTAQKLHENTDRQK